MICTFLQAQGSSNMSFIIMMVLIFVVMWFFMIRPQQKKQKELAKFRNELKRGDKIVTIGGIYGEVDEVDAEKPTILIKVAPDVKLKVDKSAVVKDMSDVQTR
ncbi:MAG: preprotein translocase subunit YajC [Bacteroidales bacterium]|nr:preprotein translocase subunit YajC [Candidatus Egerieousia equi]